MTNSESIIVDLEGIANILIREDLCSITPIEKAISALQENDKLKAENEQYKSALTTWNNANNEMLKFNQELKDKNEQLKAELEQSVRLPFTNADKIRFMSDEELAEFLSENTNCDCCNIQCIDKLNCPSMSSCLFRFREWLKSEVSE